MRPAYVLTIISIAITWLITALVLLVYSFTYLDSINQSITSFLDLKTLLLILTATFAILSLLVTGYYIDRKPKNIHLVFGFSLIIAIICLLIIGSFNGIAIGIAF